MLKSVSLCVLISCSVAWSQDGSAGPVSPDAVETLRNAQKSGAVAAQQALKQIVRDGQLIEVLKGFRRADPIAANWLRAAFEAAFDKKKADDAVPVKTLADFIRDTANDGRARRLAFDRLKPVAPQLTSGMIPRMLMDPVPEFRRDAIEVLIKTGREQLSQGRKDVARQTFLKALRAAVHADQVTKLAKPLRNLGEDISIRSHFAFLSQWSVVGPFSNKDGIGFNSVYGPEKELDLTSNYAGSKGAVRWQKLSTDDDFGKLDIAKQIENFKGSCMYATTTYNAAQAGSVEIRVSTPNAWKLWLNGNLVFGHEEYHRSPRNIKMDHFRVPIRLKSGPNRLLLKVCQNEQEESWAQRYEFQVRITNATGAGLPAAADSRTAAGPR